MPLKTVTITGADDRTAHADIFELSRQYPFVEWGILIGSNTGPRFPSTEWISNLIASKPASVRLNLSLHVCGRHLRGLAEGHATLFDILGPDLTSFQRVQLNWHGGRQPEGTGKNICSAFDKLTRGNWWNPTLIFQLDGVNDDLFKDCERLFDCAGLFDASHGAGILPKEWPAAREGLQCGWAGGLGPYNLALELPRISAKALRGWPHWVDMETQVRTPDDATLDMVKVAKCLSIADMSISMEQIATELVGKFGITRIDEISMDSLHAHMQERRCSSPPPPTFEAKNILDLPPPEGKTAEWALLRLAQQLRVPMDSDCFEELGDRIGKAIEALKPKPVKRAETAMGEDMVEALRRHADSFNKSGVCDNPGAYPDLYREAASEIERLQGAES